jgi:RNA polymerase sigma-70 factor (ECF subfamily)
LESRTLSLHTGNSLARAKAHKQLASDSELSDFLKNVEKKAFKRAYYHVRDEDAALDIVQDSMIKLCTNYADKPIAELPLLFQRILSNTVLDWFRRQKTKNALFTNLSDFDSDEGDGVSTCSRSMPAARKKPAQRVQNNGLAGYKPLNTSKQRSWPCPHVNGKPSCCVIGRSWTWRRPRP